jgi:hypothetical protein
MDMGAGISNGQQQQQYEQIILPPAKDPAKTNYNATQTQEQGEVYTQRTDVDSINDPALQVMMASQAWMAMSTGNAAPLVTLTEPKQNTLKTSSGSSDGAITSTGSGGSSAAGLPASEIATYQEGLEIVLTDTLKKMLPGMTQNQIGNLEQAFQMLMAKTKNEIISHMWEEFQKCVDENNARSIEKSKQEDIIDTDREQYQLKEEQIKYDLRNHA